MRVSQDLPLELLSLFIPQFRKSLKFVLGLYDNDDTSSGLRVRSATGELFLEVSNPFSAENEI